MWNFGWHLRGTVSLDGAGSDRDVLDRIQELLEEEWKTVTERCADWLVFEGSSGPHWLALMIYDRGRFWIEQGHGARRLRYDLRSLHAMIYSGFAALAAFVAGLAIEGLATGLGFAAVAFAFLYIINILVAPWRVPSAIRKAVSAT